MDEGNAFIAGEKKKKKVLKKVFFVFVFLIFVTTGIIIFFVIKNNVDKKNNDNNGLEVWRDITYRYDTESDYTSQDVIADFEDGYKKCKTSVCKVNILLGQANFVYDFSNDIDAVDGLLMRAESEVPYLTDLEKVDYYSLARDLMNKANREDDAKSYESLMIKYLYNNAE